MRSRLPTVALALLLGTGLAVELSALPGSQYRPAGPGVIDGNAAVAVLPAVYEGRSLAGYLDPAGLEVRLAATDESGAELAYPAGTWFVPPKGRYRMWLQGGWRMSPVSRVVAWGPTPGAAGRISDATLVPAGLVKLPETLDASPGLELHLLHAGSYLEDDFARWEISLRRAVAEVGDGVLLPEGKAVGALWDRKNRRYVAVSRPFEVRERRTVEVPLRQPVQAADLVVQLTRKTMALRAADMEVKLAVRQQGSERPADLAVFTADRVYGFWYELPAGPAELVGEGPEDILPAQSLQLQAGKIERVTAQMAQRPALEVQLDLPSKLRHENPLLEIRLLPSGEVLERRVLKPDSGTERFEKLPAASLRVDLQTAVGAFSGKADLSSGRDGFLLLKPELITLTGRVFHGDDGHPAKLTFANAARETKIETEDDGRYEAVFLEAVQTVSIQLDGVEREPWFDFFRPAITASQELDFRIPAGDFRVRVRDARTGEGIAGAAVEVRNNLLVRSLPEGDEVFSGRANGEGIVEVPRGQAGVLLIKHPAAVAVRDWQPRPEGAENPGPEWVLTTTAERPLAVQVKNPSRNEGVARAEILVWLEGRLLSGRSLAWLTGGPPSTDSNGFWTGNSLPRSSLAILAWLPHGGDRGDIAAAGALGSQATQISYPWTRVIELNAVE